MVTLKYLPFYSYYRVDKLSVCGFFAYGEVRLIMDINQKAEWTPQNDIQPGKLNVIRHPFVEPTRVLLPPLHMKLGSVSL